MEVERLLNNVDKYFKEPDNKEELEKLYWIYMRVQSGDKSAMDELFKERNVDDRRTYRADERYKERRRSNMDNVLDADLILDNEKENEKKRQKDQWLNSSDSKVTFQFSCLNRLLYNKKKKLLSKEKNTGYENGKKKENNNHSKFYEGEYDVSDFNSLMYEVITEIFNTKTDADNCLTLDGKKNEGYPICDGISLLKNISYFTSRKINKRAKNCRLDIFDTGYYDVEDDRICSYFDKKALEDFGELENLESEGDAPRLSIYSEYLEWLKRNDIHKLFKANACDIHAILDAIMNDDDVFRKDDMPGDKGIGFGMRLVTQKKLQEIIRSRHNVNVEQGNLSKNLEIIEQRLLDHLFYSLSYRVAKAKDGDGIYDKESERFLQELDNKAYIKIFSRASYIIYNISVSFVNSGASSNDFDNYFRIIKKYENAVTDIISLEKGKKKYDMVNLILEEDDLVDDKRETLLDIGKAVITYYLKKENEFKKNSLGSYNQNKLVDWGEGCWEAELQGEFMNIKLFSNRNVKKPIQHNINKGKLMIYCGYFNFYFCDMEDRICYSLPKCKRIISRANRNHEFLMYDVG